MGERGNRDRIATLKAVGVTDEGTTLLLGRRARGKAAFRLKIDADLVSALEAARERVVAAERARRKKAARRRGLLMQSKLTPKEIQALLRQGRTVAEVARRAGVDAAWVERFEGPIVWERAGTAERARRTVMVRPRRGASRLPLGDAVLANLRARGLRPTREELDAAWDSVRRPKGRKWIVRFDLESRGRTRTAEWDFDPATGELTPLNDLAADLGWSDARRPRGAITAR